MILGVMFWGCGDLPSLGFVGGGGGGIVGRIRLAGGRRAMRQENGKKKILASAVDSEQFLAGEM